GGAELALHRDAVRLGVRRADVRHHRLEAACGIKPHGFLGIDRARERHGGDQCNDQTRFHTPDSLAFGKNSCSPPILYPAMAFWPSSEMIQSMNFWPASFFTCECFSGFTRITPYWLNRRLSPSTRISRSPRFLKE